MNPGLIARLFLGIILTDLYFFHIPLFFEQNSKNIMAVVGLVFLFFKTARNSNTVMGKDMFNLLMYACIFSFFCLISVVLNGTNDYTYVSYPGTAFIWLCAAYGVISSIELIHNKVTVRIVANYVIAVCVIQCILAQVIDLVPAFSNFVDSLVDFGQGHYRALNRLYGIGAALDPAGIRFAASLVLCAYMILSVKKTDPAYLFPLYIFAFAIITVLGNMIARTTTVGAAIGLAAILLFTVRHGEENASRKNMWKWICSVLAVIIPVVVYFYNHDQDFHSNMRFAFEGFFNWVESGTWETSSTNVLQTMYVWPDNAKTWIIGDGYFVGTQNDPYYTGEAIVGVFYMNTDVGICRFIFYCGIIGYLSFVLYFAKAADLCSERFSKYKWMFWSFVLLTVIVWLKVSTDCFLILALFVVMSSDDEDELDELDQMEEEREDIEEIECV